MEAGFKPRNLLGIGGGRGEKGESESKESEKKAKVINGFFRIVIFPPWL